MSLTGEYAAVYRRCSEDRNDQASVSEQEELGLARCQAEGWQPLLYQDNDRSASRYAKQEREDWPRLLADLDDGRFAIVWLWESSRGDRKAYEWLGFLEDCRRRGVRIYVETHGRLYDMSIPRDWKTLAEDGVANAYASDETSQRIRRHAAAAARKGLPNGQPPYGLRRLYDPATGKYAGQEPEPPYSAIAAAIVTRIANGQPLYRIQRSLTLARIPPPRGKAWCTATLRVMARNPAYAGYRRTPDGELVEAWPAIIPLETHLAAVAVLAQAKRSTLPAGHAPFRPGRQKHLLTYLARCDWCGGEIQMMKNKLGQPRYQCRAHGCVSVDPAWADEIVTTYVCDALSAPGAIEQLHGDESAAARHRAEASALQHQLDEWAATDISPRAYAIKEAQLQPKIDAAARAAEAASVPLALRDLLRAPDVRAAWDALGIPARRAVIRALMRVSVARAPDRSRAAWTDPERVLVDWVRGRG